MEGYPQRGLAVMWVLIVAIVAGGELALPYGKDAAACHREAALLAVDKHNIRWAECRPALNEVKLRKRPS